MSKNSIKKHAYLIIAYHQFDLLKKIIHLLDDPRNDIYIHINSKINNVPFEDIKCASKLSKIKFVPRVPINRGTFSIAEAELVLIEDAIKSGNNYEYFHLLSGQDLPIKSQNYIHSFFEKYGNNSTTNFIDVCTPNDMKISWYYRTSLYQILVPYILDNTIRSKVSNFIRRIFMLLQLLVGVNRLRKYEKKGCVLSYGSSWFSITNEFANYIIDNIDFIKTVFSKYTYIPEESMFQTLLLSSKYRHTLFDPKEYVLENNLNQNMRLIFWTGHVSPETITINHLRYIKESSLLFARKFDVVKDSEIIEKVVKMVKQQDYTNNTATPL